MPLHKITNGLSDIFNIWIREYKTVFRDLGVLLFFFALPFAYPILYALIYNPETVYNVPIVVIDESGTPLSREFVRNIDAASETKVVGNCANLGEAKERMYRKEAYGIVWIPRDFSKQLHRGEQGTVVLYADMSLLLQYKAMLMALSNVTLAMSTDLQVKALVGATQQQAAMATAPIPSATIRMYNPESGMATFLIPAILVLILQQSILLGIGMLAGGTYENKRLHVVYSKKHSYFSNITHLVTGKALCYTSLYLISVAYILHVVPWIFRFPQLGSQWEIYLFALPLLLSSIFFSMILSVFIRERETTFVVLVFTSILFLFLSGITWPTYAMPPFWRYVSYLVPATWGIEGFVKMSTSGAALAEVKHPYWMLWILTGLYFIGACFVYRYQIYRDKVRGFSGTMA